MKNKDFLYGMKKACKLASKSLSYACSLVDEGVTTNEINNLTQEFIFNNGGYPASLNYLGFPKSICTSVNDVICHGVPDDKKLVLGDIINIDISIFLSGFYGDCSRTISVGKLNSNIQRFVDVSHNAMLIGIQMCNSKTPLKEIGKSIETYVTNEGFHVVKEIGGHGIGNNLHQSPFIPSYNNESNIHLMPYNCITIEPAIKYNNVPIIENKIPNSQISCFKTNDKCLSAQFEHTILITKNSFEILTL